MKSIYAIYLELWASCTAFLPGHLSTTLSQSEVAANTHPYWFRHCLPPGWELQRRHLLCMLVDNTGTTTSAIIRTIASAIYFGPGGVLEVLAPVRQYARQGTGTSLFCPIQMCWLAPDSLQPCPDLLPDMNLSPVSYTAFCPELNKLIQISCQFSIQTSSRLENGCQSSMQWLSFHTAPVMFRPQWLYLCTIKPVRIYKINVDHSVFVTMNVHFIIIWHQNPAAAMSDDCTGLSFGSWGATGLLCDVYQSCMYDLFPFTFGKVAHWLGILAYDPTPRAIVKPTCASVYLLISNVDTNLEEHEHTFQLHCLISIYVHILYCRLYRCSTECQGTSVVTKCGWCLHYLLEVEHKDLEE